MKLNNKGLTLIELLISIALVSIVMGFMFKLLSDAQDARNNNSFAIENQINRNEIIKTIQNDLTSYKIEEITNEGNNIITFSYEDELIPQNEKDFNLTVSSDSISYQTMEKNKDNQLEKVNKKWTMKECTLGDIIFMTDSENNIINIRIPVYTTNDNNSVEKNNLMDDIVIDYVEGSNTDDDGIVYSYWNDGFGYNSYNFPNTPTNSYSSRELLANEYSQFSVKPVYIETTSTEYLACMYYNKKEFCMEANYWDTDAETTKTNLQNAMESALGTSADNCNYNNGNAWCSFSNIYCNASRSIGGSSETSYDASCYIDDSECHVFSDNHAWCYQP